MKQIEVESAGMTDTGLVRTDNQDHFFVANLTRSMSVQSGSVDVQAGTRLFGAPLARLFLVADGMGGHRAGSEASQMAIRYFVTAILNSMRWLVRIEPQSDAEFVEDLKRMLSGAHREMQSQSKEQVALQDMGTTLTMAYVAWPRMFVVHAGDTRCYVLRDGKLNLLTRDHTVANQMMQAGRLDPNSVERSPWSNVLVNALGAGAPDVFADIYKFELRSGDTILLCSDGLNKHADDEQIRKKLLGSVSVHAACKELIDLAKAGGGSDNVTVVAAKFQTSDEASCRMRTVATAASVETVVSEFEYSQEEIDTNLDEKDPTESPTDSFHEPPKGLRDTLPYNQF